MNIKQQHEQFCEYQTAFKGYVKGTIDGYKSSFRLLLVWRPELQNVDELNEMMVQEFFYWRRTVRKWKASTFITHHKNLMPFFDYAVKNGFIYTNPFANIDKPRQANSLPKSLTKQQAMESHVRCSLCAEATRVGDVAVQAALPPSSSLSKR